LIDEPRSDGGELEDDLWVRQLVVDESGMVYKTENENTTWGYGLGV
jgi:hypothetical protein